MSSVERHRQFPSARPGVFIRASLPRFSKSGSGAMASPAIEDRPYSIKACAASLLLALSPFRYFQILSRWSSVKSSNQPRERIWKYLKGERARSSEAAHALIELAWSSMAGLAMAPLPDLLNLGKEARMNTPGRAEGNWRWRSTEDMLSDSAFEWLRELTKGTNRSGTPATYGLRSEERRVGKECRCGGA